MNENMPGINVSGASGSRRAGKRNFAGIALVSCLAALGYLSGASSPLSSPAISEDAGRSLPAPPANGVMGFVVNEFVPPIIPGTEPCPDGPVLKLRDAFLAGLDPAERERLSRKENTMEFEQRWQLSAFGPNGINICTHPDMFDRPIIRTVQSDMAIGLDLDGDGGKGGKADCGQKDFVSPQGWQGVDNQEYRVMGCKLEWRGVDGMPSDIAVGPRQFHLSGEWTQVILLRGVDSLENDDEVEVIYGNTPDRPFVDSNGQFLPGATFTISTDPPRERNLLRGKIRNGVLTTEPAEIKLTETWGQGGARDIRGNRTKLHYYNGRLRMEFQADGSMKGLLAGYRPLFDLIISPSLGGAGSAIVAGIDCAAELKTLRKFADGLKNPETGQCEGVSSAVELSAIPAFVNDAPGQVRTASK